MQTDFVHTSSVFPDRARAGQVDVRHGGVPAVFETLGSTGSRIVAGLFAAGRDLMLRYRRRAVERALGALDDRTLKDIGLYRGDIPSAAALAALGLDPRPLPPSTGGACGADRQKAPEPPRRLAA